MAVLSFQTEVVSSFRRGRRIRGLEHAAGLRGRSGQESLVDELRGCAEAAAESLREGGGSFAEVCRVFAPQRRAYVICSSVKKLFPITWCVVVTMCASFVTAYLIASLHIQGNRCKIIKITPFIVATSS